MLKVETDINKRWEQGMEHHPKSVEAIEALGKLDYYLGNDSLCLKTGGDGDNGEHMMYLLDIFFEAQDKGISLDEIVQEVKPEHLEKMKNKYPGMF